MEGYEEDNEDDESVQDWSKIEEGPSEEAI